MSLKQLYYAGAGFTDCQCIAMVTAVQRKGRVLQPGALLQPLAALAYNVEPAAAQSLHAQHACLEAHIIQFADTTVVCIPDTPKVPAMREDICATSRLLPVPCCDTAVPRCVAAASASAAAAASACCL
eukprot:15711-Heterococcus_DN1.PRE.1